MRHGSREILKRLIAKCSGPGAKVILPKQGEGISFAGHKPVRCPDSGETDTSPAVYLDGFQTSHGRFSVERGAGRCWMQLPVSEKAGGSFLAEFFKSLGDNFVVIDENGVRDVGGLFGPVAVGVGS